MPIDPLSPETAREVEADVRPTIYIASKTTHAARWRDLRSAGLPIISTWIDEAGKGETACFADLWRRCVSEAASADALIVYREPGEVLKGAFVEVGAALASGKPVYAVGCDEFSFVNHRLVRSAPTLDAAISALDQSRAASETRSADGGRGLTRIKQLEADYADCNRERERWKDEAMRLRADLATWAGIDAEIMAEDEQIAAASPPPSETGGRE
ncbi:MAG TPA: hypothetical protein VHL98_10845 [Microvirga sp.]|jgi:hypothetical protein|nr:hypothetical protein [Microvirga sp.]